MAVAVGTGGTAHWRQEDSSGNQGITGRQQRIAARGQCAAARNFNLVPDLQVAVGSRLIAGNRIERGVTVVLAVAGDNGVVGRLRQDIIGSLQSGDEDIGIEIASSADIDGGPESVVIDCAEKLMTLAGSEPVPPAVISTPAGSIQSPAELMLP